MRNYSLIPSLKLTAFYCRMFLGVLWHVHVCMLGNVSQTCQYQFIRRFNRIPQCWHYWPYHYIYETHGIMRTRTRALNMRSIETLMFDINENTLLIISAFILGFLKTACTISAHRMGKYPQALNLLMHSREHVRTNKRRRLKCDSSEVWAKTNY